MSKLVFKVQRFLASEDGPTAVEYAVMLALIIAVCIGGVITIGQSTDTSFTNIAGKVGGS